LGIARSYLGQFDEALAHFQKSVELDAGTARIHDNYLAFLHYHPRATLAGLRDVHAEYDRRLAAPFRSLWRPHANIPNLERPLRIGFISPHFASHPGGRFLVRLLENLDPSH